VLKLEFLIFKQNKMKKIGISLIVLLFTTSSFAQNIGKYLESQKHVMKKEKKEMVKDVLELTEDQSKVFWPIYDEYMNELKPFNNILVNTITEYMDKYETMTNADADRLYKNYMVVDESWLKLKKKYYKKMHKVLPAIKVVRYFQLENRLRIMILGDLTIDLPMVGDNDGE